METFVLTIWFWMGDRFEQAQIGENLSRDACGMDIQADRALMAKGKCVGANGTTIKAAKIVPHICGYSSCTPMEGSGSHALCRNN